MENQSLAAEFPTENGGDLVEQAARWLALNRDSVVGPVIPFLKSKFGLKNLGAIEATKRAHALRYGGHAS
ncbi:hypothetical protein [Rhizobium sp. 1399]|uniref:hypothetical protein n=1 Tax=Rhizobium sp. 1399 TaxID=2817758 RepID=UPI002859D1CF|nr:hypothetical protein [Rhizobium sp. 1399]MDR6664285.1 hypothetical protein [Rhizobium sp. 1399]